MYLYKTRIIKDTSVYTGISAGDVTAHGNAKTDFETNHKASCLEISERLIAETTTVISLNYADFDANIATPVAWADVQYTNGFDDYELSILTSTLL